MVRLTGEDLNRLVARRGLPSVASLRTEGLVAMVREFLGDRALWRPRMRFRTKPLRQCPFLINDVDDRGVYRGLCSLHPHDKPLVCALSPLSREVEAQEDLVVSERWSFVPPVEGCPGMGRGEVLTLTPPNDLRHRLQAEVRWIHELITETEALPDEDAAWNWLARRAP